MTTRHPQDGQHSQYGEEAMHNRGALVVGALCVSAMMTTAAIGAVGVTLEWTFDGAPAPGNEYWLSPGGTVTVGLRAHWFDTDMNATAFGALVGADISITGDTGTDRLDEVKNLMRVSPFDFGSRALDGMLTANPDSFFITGVGPGQFQFDDAMWDFGNPTGIIWEFEFNAGPDNERLRTIVLDITAVDNALLFTGPARPAIDVSMDLVGTSSAFIHVPTPGALGLLAIAGLSGCRRRRKSDAHHPKPARRCDSSRHTVSNS